MNTVGHDYAEERARSRRVRTRKYRELACVRKECEREQRARARGLIREI
jgi:hypothetical protein